MTTVKSVSHISQVSLRETDSKLILWIYFEVYYKNSYQKITEECLPKGTTNKMRRDLLFRDEVFIDNIEGSGHPPVIAAA